MERRKPRLIFITGGARSGKSVFAEMLAGKFGKKIAFIATAQALDEEMAERIARHRVNRPAQWKTYEGPIDIEGVLDRAQRENNEVIIIDCLTVFISNLMREKNYQISEDADVREILDQIKKVAKKASVLSPLIIVVSNEVGMGIVPENRVSRSYRDILGKANQVMASEADQVILMVSGIPIFIKGRPCHDMV